MSSFAVATRRINKKISPIIDEKKLQAGLQRANKTTAELMKRDFESVVATWQNRPVFKQKTSSRQNNIYVVVSTDSDIFRFLDQGTRVRYATMSADFQPKTRVGLLTSMRGQGGLLFVDTSKPRPGIKARKFTITIEKKRTPDHVRRVDKAIKDALND